MGIALGELQAYGTEKSLLKFLHDGYCKLSGYGGISAASCSLANFQNVEHIKCWPSFVQMEANGVAVSADTATPLQIENNLAPHSLIRDTMVKGKSTGPANIGKILDMPSSKLRSHTCVVNVTCITRLGLWYGPIG